MRHSKPPMAPSDIVERLRQHFGAPIISIQANRRENAGVREDARNARTELRKWREDAEEKRK